MFVILGRFSDALSLVVLAYRAIDDRASDPEASIVLAQSIAVLNAVYTEKIDVAEGASLQDNSGEWPFALTLLARLPDWRGHGGIVQSRPDRAGHSSGGGALHA